MASPDLLQAARVKLMKEKFEKYWGRWHEEKEKEKEDDTRLIANERVKGKNDEKENENINFLICVATAFGPSIIYLIIPRWLERKFMVLRCERKSRMLLTNVFVSCLKNIGCNPPHLQQTHNQLPKH
jgi:hypothetical protein